MSSFEISFINAYTGFKFIYEFQDEIIDPLNMSLYQAYFRGLAKYKVERLSTKVLLNLANESLTLREFKSKIRSFMELNEPKCIKKKRSFYNEIKSYRKYS